MQEQQQQTITPANTPPPPPQVFQPPAKTKPRIFGWLLLHSFLCGIISAVLFSIMVIYSDAHGETDAGLMIVAAPMVAAVGFVLGLFFGLISIGIHKVFHRETKHKDLMMVVYAPVLLMLLFILLAATMH
jgi:hypothetical protein